MTTHPASRRRGRPSANLPSAREQILAALAQILDAAPLSHPSLRSIAQTAAVTPALLHYHFRDLPGLMRCLQEERASPLLLPLLRELQRHQPTAATALARFLSRWTTLVLRQPWVGACLLQAPAEPSAMPGLGQIVRAAVAAAQQQGSLRRDLPDSYIAMLLLTLAAMPQLAQTGLARGLEMAGMTDPEAAAAMLLRHLAVLQAGVAAPHSPRQDSTS